VALNLEFDYRYDSTAHTDLRSESAIKKLIKEGRPPCLLAHDGEMELDRTICFIPANRSKPAETFEVSFKEAGRIAKIRDMLQRQH